MEVHQEVGDILRVTMSALIIDYFLQIVTTLIVYGAFSVIISFTLWMIVDAAKQDRFWWIVIIWAIPGIGPAVYYLTEKKHEYAKLPSHHIHTSETEAQHEKTPIHHEHHKKEDTVILAVHEESDSDKKEKDHKEEKSA